MQTDGAAAAAAEEEGVDAAAAAAAGGDDTAIKAEPAGDVEMSDAAAAAPEVQPSVDPEAAAAAAVDEGAPADAAAATAAAEGEQQAAVDAMAIDPAAAAETTPAAASTDTAPSSAAADAAPAAAPAEAAAALTVVDDAAIKAAWLAQQEGVYQATRQRLEAVQGFEGGIRRPYWHHKPLDAQQLANWVAYLDWQQQQGDVAATQRLFERCLVPCANYPGGACWWDMKVGDHKLCVRVCVVTRERGHLACTLPR